MERDFYFNRYLYMNMIITGMYTSGPMLVGPM